MGGGGELSRALSSTTQHGCMVSLYTVRCHHSTKGPVWAYGTDWALFSVNIVMANIIMGLITRQIVSPQRPGNASYSIDLKAVTYI